MRKIGKKKPPYEMNYTKKGQIPFEISAHAFNFIY